MPRPDVEPLPSARASLLVRDVDLASNLSIPNAGAYPGVLATTRMIALMEVAAAHCLVPLLEPDELTVGVTVDVRHTAATPPGVEVIATARFLGRQGKLFQFEVEATDPGGEIGRGRHERAIVQIQRLLDGAAKRAG
jgi:fluoroacetyl-CoA thioesterase